METEKFELGAKIEVYDMDREEALIVTEDGFIYSSPINHQVCMMEMSATYWRDRNIDLSEDDDLELEKAIEITDALFRENRLFGFDVYCDSTNNYLVSHYPQNLEKCYEQMKEYAEANNMILATFNKEDHLGCKCYEVIRKIDCYLH